MKRISIFIFCALACLKITADSVGVLMTVRSGDIDDGPIGHNIPKMPIRPMTIYIDERLLTLPESHSDYVLRIVNNGGVVYSVDVPFGINEVILPSFLSGEYVIQILQGNYVFEGEIELL